MNCSEVQAQLSAYFDGELSGEDDRVVAEHLQDCDARANELAAMQKLSALASKLESPQAPEMWDALERRLDEPPTLAAQRESLLSRHVNLKRLALAASLLIVIAIGYFAMHGRHAAMDFDAYLTEFQRDPVRADQVLVNHYQGRRVELAEAARELKYQPAVADLPPGYSLQTSHLLRMPCCTCVQAVCKRDDGGFVAIIEHEQQQPVQFGDRPLNDTTCNGKDVCLCRIDDRLAATWQNDQRHLTIIGARDEQEVGLLIDHFAAFDRDGSNKNGRTP